MHGEFFVVPQETADRYQCNTETDARIIAVGTTSVRTLESATNDDGILQGYEWLDSNFYLSWL